MYCREILRNKEWVDEWMKDWNDETKWIFTFSNYTKWDINKKLYAYNGSL